MKTLNIINWILIAVYVIYAIIIYFDTHRSGMDAAGRGMTMGFLLIGIIYIGVLTGLNFINIKWVKLLVLGMAAIPLFLSIIQVITSVSNQKRYSKLAEKNAKFQDPHLNAMADAIQNNNILELEKLLEKDAGLINHIGETNRQSILQIAVRSAFTRKTEESRKIVDMLLDKGADPNLHHPNSFSTLAQYGEYLDTSLFLSLLKAGADPSVICENRDPLLYNLIQSGGEDSFIKIKYMLQYGIDPNLSFGDDQPYKANYSPLVYAAHNERWKVCQLLIRSGADIHFIPGAPDGRTFKFILEEKKKEYQSSGNIPGEFQALLASEKLKDL